MYVMAARLGVGRCSNKYDEKFVGEKTRKLSFEMTELLLVDDVVIVDYKKSCFRV